MSQLVVEGAERLQKSLQKFIDGLQAGIIHKEVAQTVAKRARELAPVKTGALRRSIHADGNTVIAATRYARWVNYGQVIHKAGTQMVNRQGRTITLTRPARIKPNKFFTNAQKESGIKGPASRKLNKELKQIKGK
jgi:hypothetical protein